MRRLMALLAFLFLMPFSLFSQETFIEGQHYERITPAVKTANEAGTVEVVGSFLVRLPTLL